MARHVLTVTIFLELLLSPPRRAARFKVANAPVTVTPYVSATRKRTRDVVLFFFFLLSFSLHIRASVSSPSLRALNN